VAHTIESRQFIIDRERLIGFRQSNARNGLEKEEKKGMNGKRRAEGKDKKRGRHKLRRIKPLLNHMGLI